MVMETLSVGTPLAARQGTYQSLDRPDGDGANGGAGGPTAYFISLELSSKAREINWRSFEYYPPLDRIKRYTEEHYPEEIPLSCAAEVAGMEATYFSTFFRKKVGIRYTDWLSCMRISHAIRMIESHDRPIAAVAMAVGFCDLRTFQRTFKRITGMTAREYKEKIRP